MAPTVSNLSTPRCRPSGVLKEVDGGAGGALGPGGASFLCLASLQGDGERERGREEKERMERREGKDGREQEEEGEREGEEREKREKGVGGRRELLSSNQGNNTALQPATDVSLRLKPRSPQASPQTPPTRS